MSQNTGKGTEVVANVRMEPMGEHTLSSVEWYCEFWTTSRRLRIDKSESFMGDANNYVCYVDSSKVGRGALWGQLFARIPDSRATDGYREEVSVPFPIMAAEDSDKQLCII